VDGCESCGGLWFDADELGRIARGGKDALGEAEGAFEPPEDAQLEPVGDMCCPKCGAGLYEFEFKHSPGIKLDACRQCKGVWVDDGELGAIAQRMASTQKPAAPRTPSLREKVRQSVSFMQRARCRRCGEENYAGSLVCWVCGTAMGGRRGAMLCPRCDSSLIRKEAGAADIDADARLDHCECCGGIWIEPGDLSLLMDLPLGWLKQWERSLARPAAEGLTTHEESVICPVCQVILDQRTYASDSRLYVDRCMCCQGTWIDRGELSLMRQVSIEQDVWGHSD